MNTCLYRIKQSVVINKTQRKRNELLSERVVGGDYYYAKPQNRAHCTRELYKINEHLMNGKQMKSSFSQSCVQKGSLFSYK